MSKNATKEAVSDYELACTDCSFQATVSGTFLDALDAASSHEEKYEHERTTHFVNVTKTVA
jgi:hypothetical protein